MKHRIATDSLAREFRLLRNRIEAEVHAPAVILVTSATDRDGAGLTAYGLAESLSKTHQRTALLTTSATPVPTEWSSSGVAAPRQRRRSSDRLDAGNINMEGGFSIVSVSHERLATISRASIAELVSDLRAEHDYVVIDGGSLPENTFGLLLLPSATATLIAFLAGRQQLPADRTMLDTLEKAETKVLGVVMNDQATIDNFVEQIPKREPGIEREVVEAPAKLPTPSTLARRLEVALPRIGKSN
jgi:Mrp family chromosome partitioning ATPase